ncbi:MAG TPA: hypothetical protein VEO00_06370 [Actinomycetota bacterium]|nr:hypothetical protein [Actinomycetota bacterium]
MEARDLRSFVHFSDDAPVRETVFETERLWAQVICVGRNQSYGPVADPAADAIVEIVAGEAVVLADRQRKRVKQWETLLIPAGAELSITNASPDPLVVFVLLAPPPAAEAPGGR